MVTVEDGKRKVKVTKRYDAVSWEKQYEYPVFQDHVKTYLTKALVEELMKLGLVTFTRKYDDEQFQIEVAAKIAIDWEPPAADATAKTTIVDPILKWILIVAGDDNKENA